MHYAGAPGQRDGGGVFRRGIGRQGVERLCSTENLSFRGPDKEIGLY